MDRSVGPPHGSGDAARYSQTVDATASNSAHALALELVGAGQRVLEFGCGEGSVTRALTEAGCRVVGLERDPAAAKKAERYADEVLVVDLDVDDWAGKLPQHSFDVALFGDVLEHLREPLPVLRATRQLLTAGGFVVLSVPNIAHVDVRLSLLSGRFDYRPTGLLDESHLRFFTRTTLEALLEHAGYVPTDLRRVVAAPGTTELGIEVDTFDSSVVDVAMSDPEARTYQFVVKALKHDAHAELAQLSERVLALQDALHRAEHEHQLDLVRVRADQQRALADIRDRHAAVVRGHIDHVHAAMQHASNLEQGLEALGAAREAAEARARHLEGELEAMRATRLFRWTTPARRLYGRVRRAPG